MIRLGLCCVFIKEPIRFRRVTASALSRLTPELQRRRLAELCAINVQALQKAMTYCAAHGIGAFRVNSQILPLATHPRLGYKLADLPGGEMIMEQFRRCGRFARAIGLRLSFHPDQFVLLNSPRKEVVAASVRELCYQAEVASWIGADVINIHGGGAYGDPVAALRRLRRNIEKLPDAVRSRLTLENDDRIYRPAQLLPVCRDMRVPLCYDVHHHRCLADGLTIMEVTEAAQATWDREPLFHLSSPLHGWRGANPEQHHDYIRVSDFPSQWFARTLTVEVEAKAKERAVLQLVRYLRRRGVSLWKGNALNQRSRP